MSSTTAEPTTREIVRRNACTAAPAIFMPVRVGIISSRNTRLSSSRSSRAGASRKSSACRLGGVSTTIRSKPPSSWSSCSFSIAMYSCVPESAPEMFR